MRATLHRSDGSLPQPDALDEESQLMAAALQGDRDAFGELALRHERPALSLALEIVRNRDDAHELVQESILKAWRARNTFQAGKPFAPWFYRILRNTCVQYLRARKRRSDIPWGGAGDTTPLAELPDRNRTRPEEELCSQEDGHQLGAALGSLAHREATVIVLRYFLDLSYEEIAERLDVPVNSVRSRLKTARARLAATMAPLRSADAPELSSELFRSFVAAVSTPAWGGRYGFEPAA